MSVRRFAAAVAAAVWVVPHVLVAGIALHVALDHDHRAAPTSIATPAIPVEPAREHASDARGHEHDVVAPADLVARQATSGRALTPPKDAVRIVASLGDPDPATSGALPSPPPRSTGPPLLALLSTLRL